MHAAFLTEEIMLIHKKIELGWTSLLPWPERLRRVSCRKVKDMHGLGAG